MVGVWQAFGRRLVGIGHPLSQHIWRLQERRAQRLLPHERERHLGIDVILYFFAPHRCKGADIAFLQRLKNKAPIVPVLAKADTMTSEELLAFKEEVVLALEKAKVPIAHPPIALICGDEFEAAGKRVRGRAYPWGVALSEEGPIEHSELPRLRKFLLTDGLLELKVQKGLRDTRAAQTLAQTLAPTLAPGIHSGTWHTLAQTLAPTLVQARGARPKRGGGGLA